MSHRWEALKVRLGTLVLDSLVRLAPGTERNALAARFAEIISGNIVRSAVKRRQFQRLRGSIFVVMNDLEAEPGVGRGSLLPDWGGAITLRFDLGQLTVYGGQVGVPDVTVRGVPSRIDGLADFQPSFAGRSFSDLGGTAVALGWVLRQEPKQLKWYGFRQHPRLSVGFLRVLSRHRW